MSEFDKKEYTEYNLENFAVREKSETSIDSANDKPLKRTSHTARTKLNLKKLLMFASCGSFAYCFNCCNYCFSVQA